jgi:hypothetical protein
MQGFDSGVRELLDAQVWAGHMLSSRSVFGLLASERDIIFPDSMFEDLFRLARGRPSVPGCVVASVMVLQALHGFSDREAVDALSFDLRWKVACGLSFTQVGFHSSVLTVWRRKIAASDKPNRIFDAVMGVVKQSGVLAGRSRRALDSTIMVDAVQTQDTVTQLIAQIRQVARCVPEATGVVAGLTGHDYSKPGKPSIAWDDMQARDELVSALVQDALTVLGAVDHEGLEESQQRQVALLALVAGQDVEPAEGSDGTDGRWRIARKVAPDRVISVVDPEARHAHKSRARKIDGFKAHVVTEPDTSIVTVGALTKAAGAQNSDAAQGVGMITTDPTIDAGAGLEVLGDSGYGSGSMITKMIDAGHTPIIKPLPLRPPVPGGFTADDFTLDQVAQTVTCPAKHTRPLTPKGGVRFGKLCLTCPLKNMCTKAKNGRTLALNANSITQREHRARARDPHFQHSYRKHRPMVERTIAFMTRGVRRVPYRGVQKNNAWWNIRAASINLKLLQNLGLTKQNGAWSTG